MNKEFIPYEQALALKKLGFDEPCFGAFNKNKALQRATSDWWNKNTLIRINSATYADLETLAPLYQQALRWFREKYGLQSYINPELSFSYNNPKYTVIFIKTAKNFVTYKDDTIWIKESIERKRFDTYEEAELECLKKLIKIIKDGKK